MQACEKSGSVIVFATSHYMNPYLQLAEAERIRLIGDLLAAATIRFLSDQPRTSRISAALPPATRVTHIWDLVDDEIEKAVLRFLSAHQSAKPAQLERLLNVPHMTLSRRLMRLRTLGFVVVSGMTRNASYSLARGERIIS